MPLLFFAPEARCVSGPTARLTAAAGGCRYFALTFQVPTRKLGFFVQAAEAVGDFRIAMLQAGGLSIPAAALALMLPSEAEQAQSKVSAVMGYPIGLPLYTSLTILPFVVWTTRGGRRLPLTVPGTHLPPGSELKTKSSLAPSNPTHPVQHACPRSPPPTARDFSGSNSSDFCPYHAVC